MPKQRTSKKGSVFVVVILFQGSPQLPGTSTISTGFGKKEYTENKRKEEQQKAAEEGAERATERQRRVIERQEVDVAEKRKHLNLSGNRVADIHFTETSTSASTEKVEEYASIAQTTEMEPTEPLCATSSATSDAQTQTKESIIGPTKDAETQIEEFTYMFYRQKYQALEREYFSSEEKVFFYTGLPSYQVLVATLNHVTPHVTRRTQTLDPFQEFVMVLIKLRINVPFHGISTNCFKDLLVVDNNHELQVASACSLAREGKSLEDNANVLQVGIWQ